MGAPPAPTSAGSGRRPGTRRPGAPRTRRPHTSKGQAEVDRAAPSQPGGGSIRSPGRVLLFAAPWTAAHQAPLPNGFPGQEHWGGLPFPSPRCLPNPGMDPAPPALQAGSLLLSLQGMRLAEWNCLARPRTRAPRGVLAAASPHDPLSTRTIRIFLDIVPASHRRHTAATGAPTGRGARGRPTSTQQRSGGAHPRRGRRLEGKPVSCEIG